MKTVLVIGVGGLIRYLKSANTDPAIKTKYNTVFAQLGRIKKRFNGSLASYTKETISRIRNGDIKIDAVTGTNDISSLMAGAIASACGISGTTFDGVINCQDKKRSRAIQERYLPEHTVASQALSSISNTHELDFPIFIKPQRSSLTKFSYYISSETELLNAVSRWQTYRQSHNTHFQNIIDSIPSGVKNDYIFENTLLIEEPFDLPVQITVDGVRAGDCINILGITTSYFIKETLSFDRFETPHNFENTTIEKRILSVTKRIVKKSGFDNGWFNVELAYDPSTGRVVIVEINSRISAQFARMHEHVLGRSTLDFLLPAACGDHPPKPTPRDDRHSVCFILRRKQDAFVKQKPHKKALKLLRKRYPESQITVFVKEKKRLSDISQDEFTYRYAQIKIFGRNSLNCETKYLKIKKDLDNLFVFRDL